MLEKGMPMLQFYVEKVNDLKHLKALKKAIVDLLPEFIAGCLILWINRYIKWESIDQAGLLLCQLYPLFLIAAYGYHYAQDAQCSVVEIITYDISFMLLFSYLGNVSLLEGCLSILFFTFILNSFLHVSSKVPSIKGVLPQGAGDYLHKIVLLCLNFIIMAVIIYCGVSIYPMLLMLINGIYFAINSIYGILIVVLITVFFWSTGMHGVAFISTLLRPFWLQMLMLNMSNLLGNQSPLYIGTEPFYQWHVWIGGSGTTLGLVILMRCFSKSNHLRALGKAAIKSGWVNINEQIIFGTPIVMNKVMMIPFFLTPCLCAIVSYIWIFPHSLLYPSFLSPWVFPFLLGGFISSGGTLKILILLIVLFIISIIVYLPFFIYYDKQLKKSEETGGAACIMQE
ncbi:MAG: PTS transporter subunit EIIC [Beduini sp.]|uniref:PTS transporter subunit EIIC n=1 Tax=Beduini sp. TaxID=1922300 RepID=UPI0039A29C58